MTREEITTRLRVVVADDERPARAYLLALLRGWGDVEIVGEVANGTEAVDVIEGTRPDLALLDLQMPELDGLGVVRLLRKQLLPLVAFVTAYDQYAVRAFELNAVDYLLKPVDPSRLRQTLTRAHDRLERADARDAGAPDAADARAAQRARVEAAAAAYASRAPPMPRLRRIPVRRRDDVILLPVEQVLSVVADGELLHIAAVGTAGRIDRHTITYRLKDLEARLDPEDFVRLSRGALVRIDAIQKVSPMPGGTYVATLSSGQQLPISRIRARVVREQLLRL